MMRKATVSSGNLDRSGGSMLNFLKDQKILQELTKGV